MAAGLTQEQLAEQAGLSARGISDLERGVNRSPRRDTLELLIEALDLSVDERTTLVTSVRRRGSLTHLPGVRPLLAPVIPLIGREQEVAAACGLLRQADIRLLCLLGPGGVGKTRLAIEVASRLYEDFPDGVEFVALAQIRDFRLVVSTIARTLGVQEAGDRALIPRMQAYLHDKRLLLVLDNFEQVLPAAPAVGNLLSACPELSVLITSRAVLHVSLEHDLWLAPLDLPDVTESVSSDQVARSAAVRMFAARAHAARSDFVLTPGNASAVAAICVRLDGLPLAIELAAARIRHLSPEALLVQLTRRLPLLTGGACDQPPRLRSMREGIAWSHDLLSAADRQLFRRLGVFAGSFSLEAADAIAGNVGGSVGEITILDGLASLVDKCLIRRSMLFNDVPHFEMLETIREFALDQLAVSEEEVRTRTAHAMYFLELAEQAAPELTGSRQVAWLDRLETDLDNLRAAMAWFLARDEAEQALRLAVALARFWDYHSRLDEGRRWLETALARASADAVSPNLRGMAFHATGVLARSQGDYQLAQHFQNHALGLFREADDTRGIAFTLNSLGTVALYVGDERAGTLYTQGLALMREIGDLDGIAAILANLGYGALLGGDYSGAIAHCDESLAIYRRLGSKLGTANVLGILGRAVLEQGDRARATSLLRESLALNREAGNKWYIAECLEGLAGVAAMDQPVRSVRLFAAAAALCDRIGVGLPSFDRTTNERYLVQARGQLDNEVLAAAWEAGRSLLLEEAIGEALRDDR
jgi:predicted ATPase